MNSRRVIHAASWYTGDDEVVMACGVMEQPHLTCHVESEDMQREPEQAQAVTCDQCLLKLFMIGDSAAIALKRMGMRIDVHDILPDEAAS